jgi:enoyl-CoA hydratase/carnithine racemase
MSISLVRLEIIEDHILVIEIDNPPVNAISKQVRQELHNIFSQMDPSIRVIIIKGSNGIFCCGDDIKEAKSNMDEGVHKVQDSLAEFGALMSMIEDSSAPTIALIDGWCIGGGLELALSTDLRIASSSAKFRGAGVNIGLMASTYRLPQLIGAARAKELLLTADTIDANQALSYGLIKSVVPKETLMTEGLTLARTIAMKAPLSVQATKASINNSYRLNKADNDRYNNESLLRLSETVDYKRAVEAHINKETPKFEGK